LWWVQGRLLWHPSCLWQIHYPFPWPSSSHVYCHIRQERNCASRDLNVFQQSNVRYSRELTLPTDSVCTERTHTTLLQIELIDLHVPWPSTCVQVTNSRHCWGFSKIDFFFKVRYILWCKLNQHQCVPAFNQVCTSCILVTSCLESI
jgi:hypothetical protein